jgi:hypothetical protein
VRTNNVTLRSRSRARIACESDGCATRNRSAARLKPPQSATARKYSRCLVFTNRPHYVEGVLGAAAVTMVTYNAII